MYGRLDAAGRRISVKMGDESASADLSVLPKASEDEPGRVFDEDLGGVENRIGFDTLTVGRIPAGVEISVGVVTSAERIQQSAQVAGKGHVATGERMSIVVTVYEAWGRCNLWGCYPKAIPLDAGGGGNHGVQGDDGAVVVLAHGYSARISSP